MHAACSLFYTECEVPPADNILNKTIGGSEEEVRVWYNVPVSGIQLHIYQPTHAIRHSQLIQSLSLMGINEIDLGTSKEDSVVSVEYFLKDTSCINTLQNLDCFGTRIFYQR